MGFVFIPPTVVGGTVLIIERVESQNYNPGVAGWAIMADGDAEFNNLVARGSFIGGDENGAHIGINVPGFGIDNGIGFFTGNVLEAAPGRIVPFDGGISLQLQFQAPEISGGRACDLALISTATAGIFQISADTVASVTALTFDTTESWHTLPLVNGWVAFSGALVPDYRLNADATVTMRGVVKTGVGAIATLPVGYRPTKQVNIGLKSNNDANSYSWVQILTNGVIQVVGNVAAAQVWLTLDLSFSTL